MKYKKGDIVIIKDGANLGRQRNPIGNIEVEIVKIRNKNCFEGRFNHDNCYIYGFDEIPKNKKLVKEKVIFT